MMVHELKIFPCYFGAILEGRKRFEIRFNDDRGFQAGDDIVFNEIDDVGETGRQAFAVITYVTNYKQKEGYVVFGFKLEGD